MNKKTKVVNFDDEENESNNGTLGYFTKEITSYEITVPIDEVIKDQSYYRQVVQRISELSENDVVKFEISSPGGNLDGLFSILSALEKTKAITVAILNGKVHSAASMLALNCDQIFVSENAYMMIHSASFGSVGKMYDVTSHVDFVKKQTKKLVDSTYEGFLSPEEIEDVHKGIEIWLDADEIVVRLEARQKYFEEQLSQLEENETRSLPELHDSEYENNYEGDIARSRTLRDRSDYSETNSIKCTPSTNAEYVAEN